MTLYEQYITKLKYLEGFRSKAYKCPAGFYTVGYGFRTSDLNVSYTLQQADIKLRSLVQEIEDAFKTFPFVLLDHERLAIVDLIYNCGISAFKKSNLYQLIISYSHALDNKAFTLAERLRINIANNLLTWCHITIDGKKVVSEGLKTRCSVRYQLWLYGRLYN